MKNKLKEGFNEKCSNEEYHGDREFVSSSGLKLILKNPREYYRKYVKNEGEPLNSDALSIGSYAHTRILEPHLVEVEYAIWTKGRRYGEDWNTFKEENEGKIIITSSQKSLVDSMVKEYEASSVILGDHGNEKEVSISSFFTKGEAEETVAGFLDDYPVKCRFDYRKEWDDFGSINDLKTTGIALGTATVEEVEEICAYWDYDLSAALYADLAEKYTGKAHDFYFIFLSKKDFACRIFKASDEMIRRGRAKYKAAIKALKKAEETGVYFENRVEELK
jgi:hypothetical protein